MSREQLFAAFFFAVFLFLLYQLYLFVAAFFAPLVWAAILALAFYPLTNRLVALFRGRRGLAALVLVLAVTVGVVLPSFLLGSLLVREATGAYRRLQEAVQQGELVGLVEQVRGSRLGGLWVRLGPLFDQLSIDLSDLLLRATNWVSDQIVGEATALARNALRSVAVVQSMLVTAVTQGVLAGLGYWASGLGFSVFLGFITGLASFLPLAGPAFVWTGAALYLALTGHVGQAVGLAVWGVLAVSTADNWIKPLFIGGRAKLPTFPLLISILGGLSVYGFLGVFLGPVVLAILFAFVEIYREEYQRTPAAAPPPEAPERRAASG